MAKSTQMQPSYSLRLPEIKSDPRLYDGSVESVLVNMELDPMQVIVAYRKGESPSPRMLDTTGIGLMSKDLALDCVYQESTSNYQEAA